MNSIPFDEFSQPAREPVTGLFTGEQRTRGEECTAYRPQGRPDWLVIYTVAGRGRIACGPHDQILVAGDLVLVRPGTRQYYGTHPREPWHNVWSHFIPREGSLSWIDWPVLGPGIMFIRVSTDLRPAVLDRLREMDRFSHHGGLGRSRELGLNALEGALLLADQCNPRTPHVRDDPRIGRAIDCLLANLADPPHLDALARIAGLSRSHLWTIFKRDIGLTPREFTELHRLNRAREMLERSRVSLEQIADEVGFSSPFYLSLRFKRHFGMSPRDYRRRQGR